MHQVAHRYVNGSSRGRIAEKKIRVVMLLANTLDCEALSDVLTQQPNVEVIAATVDIEFGLARCQRVHPALLVIDPKASSDIIARAAEAARLLCAEHVLILDDRLHEGRLSAILTMPNVSYLTRQAGRDLLCAGVLQIARSGDRVFDPSVQGRIYRENGNLKLRQPVGQPSLGLLTSRELQVMKLLAGGYSVRRCAERLKLAESTIDNHKSRLMKKLDIHKIVELTHVAIREGLIIVE